ncbi:hypothetical protein CDAR_223411 [Caerostris darwini]|uniref:Uncharacterized protein n=1 Tax=Caerostris darwini TaxID=1538125 RepID=A0AAV4W8R3_9ARAC|nr:hypothetical protein CDAR_223411 [Caerostris darwini]
MALKISLGGCNHRRRSAINYGFMPTKNRLAAPQGFVRSSGRGPRSENYIAFPAIYSSGNVHHHTAHDVDGIRALNDIIVYSRAAIFSNSRKCFDAIRIILE